MKPITLNDQQKTMLTADFIDYLDKLRTNENSITYRIDVKDMLKSKVKAPIVMFSKLANEKMKYLVENHNKEIAWHGTVTKVKKNYYITDILVYPQTVTSVTVTTDDEEYAKWLISLDDTTFNSMRLQGHSHVNMGVSPSGTDTNYYKDLLQNLGKDDYYIFMIINKKGDTFINIYDFAQNIIFEDNDIDIKIEGQSDHANWFKESMKLIKEPKPYSAQSTIVNKHGVPVTTTYNSRYSGIPEEDIEDQTAFHKWWKEKYK